MQDIYREVGLVMLSWTPWECFAVSVTVAYELFFDDKIR